MIVNSQGTDAKQQGLESLLNQVLNSSNEIGNSRESEQSNQKVCLREQSEKLSDAYSLACNCILDLSSMPKYHNNQEETDKIAVSGEDNILPELLLALLLCSDVQSPSLSTIQLSAITAMVELSSLVVHVSEREEQKLSSEAVVVSMEPVMTMEQLSRVLTTSHTAVMIAETLWSSLELSSTAGQQQEIFRH